MFQMLSKIDVKTFLRLSSENFLCNFNCSLKIKVHLGRVVTKALLCRIVLDFDLSLYFSEDCWSFASYIKESALSQTQSPCQSRIRGNCFKFVHISRIRITIFYSKTYLFLHGVRKFNTCYHLNFFYCQKMLCLIQCKTDLRSPTNNHRSQRPCACAANRPVINVSIIIHSQKFVHIFLVNRLICFQRFRNSTDNISG